MTKIKEITVFETEDGERFETFAEAEAHDTRLDFFDVVAGNKVLASCASSVVDFIEENSRVVVAYIQRVERVKAASDTKPKSKAA